jgi:hypothetical protein
MSRTRLLGALITAALATFLTATAFAQGVTNTTVDLTGQTIVNPCNGETIVLSGSVHIVVRNTTDSDGGIHSTIENNYQGVTGVGQTTGATYHVANNSIFTANSKPPFPAEFSFPSTTKVIGQGNVPNFLADVHFKATVNANGDTTVAFFGSETQCQQ